MDHKKEPCTPCELRRKKKDQFMKYRDIVASYDPTISGLSPSLIEAAKEVIKDKKKDKKEEKLVLNKTSKKYINFEPKVNNSVAESRRLKSFTRERAQSILESRKVRELSEKMDAIELASYSPDPVIGGGASALMAKREFSKGNYGAAALNALGAIPGVGAIGKGIKYGKALAKIKRSPELLKKAEALLGKAKARPTEIITREKMAAAKGKITKDGSPVLKKSPDATTVKPVDPPPALAGAPVPATKVKVSTKADAPAAPAPAAAPAAPNLYQRVKGAIGDGLKRRYDVDQTSPGAKAFLNKQDSKSQIVVDAWRAAKRGDTKTAIEKSGALGWRGIKAIGRGLRGGVLGLARFAKDVVKTNLMFGGGGGGYRGDALGQLHQATGGGIYGSNMSTEYK